MVLEKFVNKKNSNLPPRPKPPSVDQIMHDLKNTNELGVLVDLHPNGNYNQNLGYILFLSIPFYFCFSIELTSV